MSGKLVVAEGPDGSGKSTQAKLLAEWLQSKGHKVHLTREPTAGPIGKLIRELISAKSKNTDERIYALLFTADRRFHILDEIEPKLKEGFIVISDRYYHSTFAYESTRGSSIEWLQSLDNFSIKPDLTLIFDIDPETGFNRLHSDDTRSQKDIFEKKEWLAKIRENYLKLPKMLHGERILVVNASRSIDAVHEEVKGIASKELGL